MSNSLRGKKISETYQKLVQTVEGSFYDGAGNQLNLGATGLTGPQGSTGTQGPQGPTGTQGSTGTQGPQGSTGTQGSIGPQGSIGTQGITGTQGLQGPQGTDVTNFYTEFSLTTSVPFNSLYSYCIDESSFPGNLEFTPSLDPPVPGARTVIRLLGNEFNSVSFLGIKETSISEGFDSTAGEVNILDFFYNGEDYWVTVYQSKK